MKLNKKIIIPVSILCFVIVLAIAYAAFTQTLNITGTGNVRNSSWKIYFSRLSEATTTGTATVSLPTLQANATSIGDYTATVMSPNDSISFEVDVTNDGDYDALLSNVTINGTPICKYNNDASDTSAVNVCNNLTYTIKYKGGASLIPNTDVLHSKETQTLVVELKYANITNANLLPTHNIDVTGLGISLTYVQSGNAKVNDDGTTPYVAPASYAVGDRIQVAGDTTGDYYRVIAPSGSDQDYVVALKENPLSVSEVNTYGAGHVNRYTYDLVGTAYDSNGYGGMAYYSSETCGSSGSEGCTTSYASSEIKYVVDNWASAKFAQGDLKTVGGYEVRLISLDDMPNLGYEWGKNCDTCGNVWKKTASTPTWAYYSGSSYWTMSQFNGSGSGVWDVDNDGTLSYYRVFNYRGVVRPVINLYKSKILNS